MIFSKIKNKKTKWNVELGKLKANQKNFSRLEIITPKNPGIGIGV
jgi:hypothetical protein